MPERKPREQVRVTHPSGRFTVLVSVPRSKVLAARGYTLPGQAAPVASTAPGAVNRAALIARAKELGITASGTNAALAQAVADAEDAAAGDD